MCSGKSVASSPCRGRGAQESGRGVAGGVMAWRWASLRANTGSGHLLFNGFSRRIEHNINLLTGIHDVLVGWKFAELAVLFDGPSEKVAAHLAVQRFLKRFVAGSISPPSFLVVSKRRRSLA